MDKLLQHLPYWFCILILLIIFGVRWTAPSVTKAVQSVQQVAVPSMPINRYPILGCSLSRVRFGVDWE